ncbi:hypothetical protein D3C71_1319570 [compost metagenome]
MAPLLRHRLILILQRILLADGELVVPQLSESSVMAETLPQHARNSQVVLVKLWIRLRRLPILFPQVAFLIRIAHMASCVRVKMLRILM